MEPHPETTGDRRALFTASARTYDGRPGYPAQLYDLLADRCGLGPRCRVLEIGPGTGQATGPLLDRGARVVAVELGAELAELLQSKHRGRPLQVLVGPFEEIELPDQQFDLVVAGTSFHWVPADLGLRRCATALRPGGALALWWSVFGDPARPDPFHHALQPLLRRRAPQLAVDQFDSRGGTGSHPHALDVDARVGEIEATGRFGPVEHDLIAWTGIHSAVEIRRMFATFSPWLAVEQPLRDQLLDDLQALAEDEFDGTVERPYLTSVYRSTRR